MSEIEKHIEGLAQSYNSGLAQKQMAESDKNYISFIDNTDIENSIFTMVEKYTSRI